MSSVLSCEEDHVYLNESKANVGLLDFYITHVRTCFRLYFFFFLNYTYWKIDRCV